MAHLTTSRCLPTVLLLGMLTAAPLFAQEAGEAVRIQGTVTEDIYAAGGTVDVLAQVEGDAVVVGGRITVSESISGDLMAVGGAVSVRADVADDVRLAGGDVTLSGTVGGDAIVAGGNVTLTPDARVGGRAWFAGGRIDVAGMVGRELKATGGRIVISGRVNGDVALVAQSIRILDSAIIDGRLSYKSPEEAEIASGAQILGGISYVPVEQPELPIAAAVVGLSIVLLLSLIVTGSAIYLMFPRFIETTLTTLRAEPWKCLGIGLAVFAATPVVISILFVTVIGWLPALVIGALYLILLLAGFLTGVFYVGQISFGLMKRRDVSKTKRLLAFVAALVVVILLGLIPLLGGLLLFALLLLGAGVLILEMYRAYTAP